MHVCICLLLVVLIVIIYEYAYELLLLIIFISICVLFLVRRMKEKQSWLAFRFEEVGEWTITATCVYFWKDVGELHFIRLFL